MDKPQEPIHQRINLLIERLEEGVQRRFATRVGVAPGVVNDIVGVRKSKPGFDIISKILRAYPQIRASWFVLGDGEMLKSDIPPNNYSVLSRQEPDTEGPDVFYVSGEGDDRRLNIVEVHFDADARGNVPVPLLNYQAAANYIAGGGSQEYYQELDFITLPQWMAKGGTYKALEVVGDSMAPTFAAKDIVVCRQISRPEWRYIDDLTVCVVVSEPNGVQLKRVKARPDAGILRCKSDNRAHKAFTLDIDHEVLEIWRFQFKISADASNTNDTLYLKVDNMEDQLQDLRILVEGLMDARELKQQK